MIVLDPDFASKSIVTIFKDEAYDEGIKEVESIMMTGGLSGLQSDRCRG